MCHILFTIDTSYSLNSHFPGSHSKIKGGKSANINNYYTGYSSIKISLIQYTINADVNMSICLCCFLFVTIWNNRVTVWRLADFNFCTFLRQGVDLCPILFSVLTIESSARVNLLINLQAKPSSSHLWVNHYTCKIYN